MPPTIAVIIPCYRVKNQIHDVLERIGPEVDHIIVVDDHCPEFSGRSVQTYNQDTRIHVLYHKENQGVGAAVMTGYRYAQDLGATILIKLDGDGQMAPELIPRLVNPLIQGQADYAKGNRFWDLSEIRQMPFLRLLGNASLSFMSKLSSGYWHSFDPTNGFTAIHASLLDHLPLHKLHSRYFFESDLLFRLNLLRAVVVDIPMHAQYGKEQSNLKIHDILMPFLLGHLRNLGKRIFYNYFLRDLTLASLELVFGFSLLLFGLVFGMYHWLIRAPDGQTTPTGTIMIATLSIILGFQLLLSFINYDVANTPSRPIHQDLCDEIQ